MTERDYKKKLKNNLIEYRNTLNLSKDITFGIEIEYENILHDLISNSLDFEQNFEPNFVDWINYIDFDVCEYNKNNEEMNGEIISPILTDNITTWENLKITLDILRKNNGLITERCGGHVNIGAHVLEHNTNYYRNLFLLWILYENEIYSFSSGEYLYVRKRDDDIIEKISLTLNKKIDEIIKIEEDLTDYLKKILIIDKTYDISFLSVRNPIFRRNNRIEFRVPNGSLSEEIWQNNINFFAKLLLTCKKELDIDKLLYKIKRKQHSPVELADLVFEEQIDKDNFLIQTLKTNKIYKKELPKHIFY